MKLLPNLKLVSLAFVGVLTACQQYHDRSDVIALSAGDAHAVNEANMVVDPWPPYLDDTEFDADGNRMSSAVDRYRSPPPAATTTPTVTVAPTSN